MKFMEWVGSKTNVLMVGGLLVGTPPYQCSDPGGGGGSGGAGGSASAGESPGGAGGSSAGEGGSGGSTAAGTSSGGSAEAGTGGAEAAGADSGGSESGGSETGGTAAGGSESGGTEAGGTEAGGAGGGGAPAGGTSTGGSAGAGGGPTFPGMNGGYDTSNPEAVKDIYTGLVWQQIPDGSYAVLDGDAAINYCNELDYAGYSDWRLPTAHEIFSLYRVESLESNYHDLTAFPNSPAALFWTRTYAALYDGFRYSMYFGGGYLQNFPVMPLLADPIEFEHNVRCVRGAGVSPRATQLPNDLILDNQTGLLWEQTLTYGLTQEEATARCSSLEGGVWRLPSVKELVAALAADYPQGFEIDPTMEAGTLTSTPVLQPPAGEYWVLVLQENVPTGHAYYPGPPSSRCVRNGW